MIFPLSAGHVPHGLPFAPDTTLRWQLVRNVEELPAELFRVGVDIDGVPEFGARAKLADGSLRPGRISRAFKRGCSVALDTLELTVSAFEVLVGAAPGFEIRIVPWPENTPPPAGAVVAGVSTRGDPLLMAVTDHLVSSSTTGMQNCKSVGFTSARDSLVQFGWATYNRKMQCCGPNCGVITVVRADGTPYAAPPGGLRSSPIERPQVVGVYYAAGNRAHDGALHVVKSKMSVDEFPTSGYMGRVVDWRRYAQGADIAEKAANPWAWDCAGEGGGESGVLDAGGVDTSAWTTVRFSVGLGGLQISFGDPGVDDSLRPDSSGAVSLEGIPGWGDPDHPDEETPADAAADGRPVVEAWMQHG